MALGAQTATSTAGSVDRVPPDLQLLGPTKQDPLIAPGSCDVPPGPLVCGKDRCGAGACNVYVWALCRNEKCTARAKGKLTNVKNDKLQPGEFFCTPRHFDRLGWVSVCTLKLFLTKQTRIKGGEALAEGKNVQAKVTVHARDAAGNVATAQRTITLVTYVK